MSHSRGGLSLGVPPSSLAWGSSDQSPQHQRVHIGGLVEGRSGGLLSGETLTQSDSATLRTLSSVGGTVGGVLRMLNQNRHYWTPPKWLSSSAVFPSDGSLPTIWRHFLWTSGGGAAMRNEPWVWPEVRDAGTSGAGAVPLRSAQMMGQQKKKKKNGEKRDVACWFALAWAVWCLDLVSEC